MYKSSLLIAASVFLALTAGTAISVPAAPFTPVPISTADFPDDSPEQLAARNTPACSKILAECEKLGFAENQRKVGNGIWTNCFEPIVKGSGHTTRFGKPIDVPVHLGDVLACQMANHSHYKNKE